MATENALYLEKAMQAMRLELPQSVSDGIQAAVDLRIAELEGMLERCRTILANMAQEGPNPWWAGPGKRWAISDEPLRNDAKNLLPQLDAVLEGTD